LQEFANYKPRDDVFAEHLRRVFKRHRVDCVFDVGAHHGEFATMLRKEAGFEGWIVSFEPVPNPTLESAAAADPKWVVCPYALGARSGDRAFHRMSSDVFSSFLQPIASQPEKYTDSNRVVQSFKVQIRTVAEVWNELRVQLRLERLYLKMDTQGFDLEVFAGAAQVLPDIPALQTELAFQPIYAGAPDATAAFAEFRSAGYLPSLINAISFDENLGVIEADGVFVRARESGNVSHRAAIPK
jgi:FkbM family methyltransferase